MTGYDPADWEAVGDPHVWTTMGWTRGDWAAGRAEVRWQADERWTFPTATGRVVHGGLVSAVLDCAMASAAYTLTGPAAPHLTVDLSVTLLRAARPGRLRATGTVLSRTRSAIFTDGALVDDGGRVLAVARATQLPAPARPVH